MALYLGIDPTSSDKKPSGCALLDNSAALVQAARMGTDADIMALTEEHRPKLVAIDAPISLPKGMCCLEESCACAPLSPQGLKLAERELFRRGISLYATTKRSIIKPMIYRAMRLRRTLEERGYEVLEVYPYASKVRLFGRPVGKKTSRAGREWLQRALAPLVLGLADRPVLLSHDELDAIVAAYTAFLHARGLAEAVGDPEEGTIILPRAGVRP